MQRKKDSESKSKREKDREREKKRKKEREREREREKKKRKKRLCYHNLQLVKLELFSCMMKKLGSSRIHKNRFFKEF